MLPYKYSDPGTPIIKAFTLTRNGIAGSASHIGHPARASGDDLGIETRQLGLGLSFLGARWGSRREHGCMVFILVCGSSRECDLRLTQMALVTLQLFSRLWQYKSQAFLCTSSCPAMACMLAFFFACARCCFRRGQLLVWAIAINAIRRPPNAERTANALWAHMPPAPCAFRSGRSAAKIPCSWRMHGTEKWPNVEIMTASEVRENRDALVSRPSD